MMDPFQARANGAAGQGVDPKTDPNSILGLVGAAWAGDDLQIRFRQEVANLLGRPHNTRFPGAQPVSFSARHLDQLKQRDYWVCEKTDGERFLLWMTDDGPGSARQVVYLINRRNEYFYVPDFYFPHHSRRGEFHRDTILDGELVEDKHPDGRREINFLVFDMLTIDGQSMMKRTLDKRMGYFKEQVLKPYQRDGRGPFAVKDKAIEFAYGLEKMFNEIIPKVKKLHGNDGLIFTCRETEYHPGTDEHILKWKPPEENTVDFLMHIVWATDYYNDNNNDDDDNDDDGDADMVDDGYDDHNNRLVKDYDAYPQAFELWVYYGDNRGEAEYRKHDTLYVSPDEWERWKASGVPLQDSIVECFQEEIPVAAAAAAAPAPNGNSGSGTSISSNNSSSSRSHRHQSQSKGATSTTTTTTTTTTAKSTRWRFHRFRHDKDEANHLSTFKSVIDSIQDRVTQEDLLKEGPEIRDCWKRRNQPPAVPHPASTSNSSSSNNININTNTNTNTNTGWSA